MANFTRRLVQTYRFLRYPDRRRRLAKKLVRRRQSANRVTMNRELKGFVTNVKSRPPCLFIDPATMCNLQCPFCPTGNGLGNIKKELLTPKRFHKIMSHIHLDEIETVSLYNWGEPLINKDLNEFIRFFHDRGKFTSISTNFSLRDHSPEFLEDLASSGLDELLVSVDGATQESYERYRLKGDFGRVIGNMRRLMDAKKRIGSSSPRVVYKMLVNRYNEHEVADARALAEECADEFRLDEHFWVPEDLKEEWTADSYKEKYGDLSPSSLSMEPQEVIHTECRQLWDSLIVNANGDVYPCCLVDMAEHAVGNLVDQHFDEIWNNDAMRSMRRYVTSTDSPDLTFPNHCEGCDNRFCTHVSAASVKPATPAP